MNIGPTWPGVGSPALKAKEGNTQCSNIVPAGTAMATVAAGA